MKNQRLYDYLKSKDLEDLNPIEKDMLRDWGNEEIYGPWTEHRTDDWDASTGFKIYKSYYLISTNDELADISILKSGHDEIPLARRILNKWHDLIKKNNGKKK